MESAVRRCERLADALPEAWFSGESPRGAKPLVELLHRLARTLESQRKDGIPGHAQLASRLSRVLSRLEEREQSKKLSQAYRI